MKQLTTIHRAWGLNTGIYACVFMFLGLGVIPAYAQNKAGEVARAMFTTDIIAREPVDQVLILANTTDLIYFFTDLREFQGQVISHRWEYKGRVVEKKQFKIKGARWRVFSKKKLSPKQLGTWTVLVTDENGWPLKAAIFKYIDHTSGQNEAVILPPVR